MESMLLTTAVPIAAYVILFHCSSAAAWRKTVFTIANVAFIGILSSFVFTSLLPLTMFLFFGYLTVADIQRHPNPRKLGMYIAILLGYFIYLKQYTIIAFIPPLSYAYSVIGLSYLLFRIIHLQVDAYHQDLPESVTLTSFFNYTCSFLTFQSGPIQRFQDFIAQYRQLQHFTLTPDQVYYACSRIVNGLIKILLLSSFFENMHNHVRGMLSQISNADYLGLLFCVALLTYLLFLYVNFSGYIDAMLGLGALLGFQLPENFHSPFATTSFLDFWNRWHITLSDWFKLYLFNPILKYCAERQTTPAMIPYYGNMAYCVTFIIMGIWHGSTPVFFFYGLFLGIGVSINKFYEIVLRKRLGKHRYAAVSNNRLLHHVTRGIALGYFAIALSCLWINTDTFHLYTRMLGFKGYAVACLSCIAIITLISLISTGVMILYRYLTRWTTGIQQSFLARQSSLAIRIYALIVIIIIQGDTVPRFVYKGF